MLHPVSAKQLWPSGHVTLSRPSDPTPPHHWNLHVFASAQVAPQKLWFGEEDEVGENAGDGEMMPFPCMTRELRGRSDPRRGAAELAPSNQNQSAAPRTSRRSHQPPLLFVVVVSNSTDHTGE